MSIQINGIDKPKSCFDCPCIDNEFAECAAKEHYLLPKDEYGAVLGDVPDWCPITELQTCDDAVSRQAAIDILSLGKEILSRVLDDMDVVGIDREKYSWGLGLIESNIKDIEELPSAQPETAKRIVGKSRDGMTLWYQCDMCNEPVDAQDNFCRGCGRRLTDG